uniref:SFRP1/5 secreted frizzled-related protein n=1 Tax=Phallusia mammillata TaxID=59560 RepID=A0A6F9DSL9_9ASCI|nr:sFRP1/5 secreted frizzled-related protein precursor [Phallusia mammillata]
MTPETSWTAHKAGVLVSGLILTLAIIQSGHRTFATAIGQYVRQPSHCVPIPANMKLCRDVGYREMMLPNFFSHESLDEAHRQSVSFVPLLATRCHPHTKIFLCSLFSPVCLSGGPIPPCRSLCLSVQSACRQIMSDFSFEWPEMLNCSKFTDTHPCVTITNATTTSSPLPTTESGLGDPRNESEASGICAPCTTPLDNTVVDNFCASEFMFKAYFNKLKISGKGSKRQIRFKKKKRTVYKQGPLKDRDLKRKYLKLSIPSSRRCDCPQVDDLVSKKGDKKGKKRKGKKKKVAFLVMGRKVNRKLLVTVIHKWDKKNKLLKKMEKKFNQKTCTLGE